jgi:ribosome-binding protein aMBF1 (putative translation factor)
VNEIFRIHGTFAGRNFSLCVSYRDLRRILNLSLRELSWAVSIPDQRLSAIEHGVALPNHCERTELEDFFRRQLIARSERDSGRGIERNGSVARVQ